MGEYALLEKTWGVYLSTTYEFSRGSNPNYPDWVEKFGFQDQGPTKLIVWSNTDHKAAVLTATESMNLLKKLTSGNDWQTTGVSITRKAMQFQIPIVRKKKKSDDKQKDDTPQNSEQSKWIDDVLVIMPPQAGFELLELLMNNQNKLQSLAEEENKKWTETLRGVYNQLIDWGFEAEEKEVNFLSRNIVWARLKDPHHWVCSMGENRGSIRPYVGGIRWYACLQFQGKEWKDKSDFNKMIDAVIWVENELQHPNEEQTNADEMDQELIHQQALANLKENVKQYSSYIKPEDLDSKVISYQTFLEVETNPISKETYETEFGEVMEFHCKFLTPLKLASLIGIDPDLYQIDQPFGENSKWCRFTGLTTYLLENLALNQAQIVWDQSKIIPQFKVRSISRARYGYLEKETKFPVIIGECSEHSLHWGENKSRHEFLEKKAFQLSVFHSLIVQDIRTYLNLDSDTMSDFELLTLMHETRAESEFISNQEKMKSQLWLSENKSRTKK